jgi:type IV secretory pathway VirJ component
MMKGCFVLLAFLFYGFTSSIPLSMFPSSQLNDKPLVIFISGDGGWGPFDQKVCENLAANGVPAIGLDARKYFWSEKQPGEVACDLSAAAFQYMKEWNKKSFILVGYSFGACVAPVIANSLNKDTKLVLKGIYCISPDETTDLEVHISDMLSMGPVEKYNVLSELKKLTYLKPVCVFGEDENPDTQKHFNVDGIRVETLPGGHRYDNNTKVVAGFILNDL